MEDVNGSGAVAQEWSSKLKLSQVVWMLFLCGVVEKYGKYLNFQKMYYSKRHIASPSKYSPSL